MENSLKESSSAYSLPAQNLTLPAEWQWLDAFKADEREKFLQDLIKAISKAKQNHNWAELDVQINRWKKRAAQSKSEKLDELRRHFIQNGGSRETAMLLGKYQGRLSSVDQFIHNKRIEKSLEQ
jgi:hypothetical protein